ncbi:MAG: thioredoxin fold domain-containing protein [Polaribacter sp.]|uniref:thioredoxin family protein n=1 Tax=Polaribacter sp. TaxID=1920175 RepID=UPI003BB13674
MKKIIIFFILLGSFFTKAQTEKPELKIYSFSEIEKMQQENPKPIVVFVFTDWCKICFGMKKNTLENSNIIKLLNNHFYFAKLNGEEKKDIHFLGKTFVYKSYGNKIGNHELAIELASINNKLNYPTTIILNKKFEIDLQIDTYINSKKMEKILNNYLKL